MFLQVFSKKVCFCCILGCFAEKKLPQMSQILTDGACLEFCEFCVLWEYSSPTDCTDQHRWLVALVVAWVRQDAIPSYICVNPCYLLETLLCKKLLCVPWVLWEYSLPRISQINTDGWLRKSSHGIHRIHRSLGAVGCVGMAGCHTLLICAHPCQSVGGASQPEGSVLSVRICGRLFSARRFRVFRAFCGRYFSTRRVRSVGDYSFSMRKRLTMPKTRA